MLPGMRTKFLMVTMHFIYCANTTLYVTEILKFPNFRVLLELSTTILLHVKALKYSKALDHNNSPEAQPFIQN